MSTSDPFLSPPESEPSPAAANRLPARWPIVVLAVLLVVSLLGVVGLAAQIMESNDRIDALEGRLRDGSMSNPAQPSVSNAEGSANGNDADLFAAPRDVAALIAEVGKSVVDIYCGESGGTGFALDIIPEGPGAQTVLVTNHHVIAECWDRDEEVTVLYGESMEKETLGIVVNADEENDLALIEIEPDLPWLKESEVFAERGWWTMAMGNPADPGLEVSLDRYVSFGHIGYVYDQYWNYTSATLNRGNSGGPLVNSRGELIGINTIASSGLDDGVWNIAVDSAVLCLNLLTCDES